MGGHNLLPCCLASASWSSALSCCLQTPYLHFVAELTRAFPTRPIILLEARHVSVCLSWRAFSTDAMADTAVEILQRWGYQQDITSPFFRGYGILYLSFLGCPHPTGTYIVLSEVSLSISGRASTLCNRMCNPVLLVNLSIILDVI